MLVVLAVPHLPSELDEYRWGEKVGSQILWGCEVVSHRPRACTLDCMYLSGQAGRSSVNWMCSWTIRVPVAKSLNVTTPQHDASVQVLKPIILVSMFYSRLFIIIFIGLHCMCVDLPTVFSLHKADPFKLVENDIHSASSIMGCVFAPMGRDWRAFAEICLCHFDHGVVAGHIAWIERNWDEKTNSFLRLQKKIIFCHAQSVVQSTDDVLRNGTYGQHSFKQCVILLSVVVHDCGHLSANENIRLSWLPRRVLNIALRAV